MKFERWAQLRLDRRFVISVPFIWLLIFFVVPFLILLRISVTDMGNGVDPFAPLMQAADGVLHLTLKYQNYLSIFEQADKSGKVGFGETIYLIAYITSVNYKAYPEVVALVEDATDQLSKMDDAKAKHEAAAAKQDWEQANLWAEQVWQYQVKAADIGLRAKTFLEQKGAK